MQYSHNASDYLVEFDVAVHMALSNTGTAVYGMEPDQLGHTHTSCKSQLCRGRTSYMRGCVLGASSRVPLY